MMNLQQLKQTSDKSLITIPSYIQQYENPFLLASKDTKLCNIFTHEVVADVIRSDMLN